MAITINGCRNESFDKELSKIVAIDFSVTYNYEEANGGA
jgi:hypothetical protein